MYLWRKYLNTSRCQEQNIDELKTHQNEASGPSSLNKKWFLFVILIVMIPKFDTFINYIIENKPLQRWHIMKIILGWINMFCNTIVDISSVTSKNTNKVTIEFTCK